MKRNLISYVLHEKLDRSPTRGQWSIHRIDGMDAQRWSQAKSFWDYAPSWQNGVDAVCSLKDTFSYILAEWEGALVGYGIVDCSNGDIAQLAAAHDQRGKGIASAILHEMQIQLHGSRLTVINVDERNVKMNDFFASNGFSAICLAIRDDQVLLSTVRIDDYHAI